MPKGRPKPADGEGITGNGNGRSPRDAVSVAPTFKVVVIGASAGGVEALKRLAETLPADLNAALAVPSGRLLFTSADDRTVRMWDVSTGECQRTISDHTRAVNALAIDPGGTLLAIASGASVRVWDSPGS